MADDPVEQWRKQAQEDGLIGSVRVLSENSVGAQIEQNLMVGVDVQSATLIPRELAGHILEILRERDRLLAAAVKASVESGEMNSPANIELRKSCMSLAIGTIRKRVANDGRDTLPALGSGSVESSAGADAESETGPSAQEGESPA